MKKCLRFCVTIVLFLTLNFSANAYTRKDLEKIQTSSAVAELILSLPMLLSDHPSKELKLLPVPAIIVERATTSALESVSLISEITNLIRIFKLYNNPKPILAQKVLSIIVHKIIMKKYPEKKNRIKRRVLRIFANTAIDFILSRDQEGKKLLGENPNASSLGQSLELLVIFLVAEFIGEIIIQGAEDV